MLNENEEKQMREGNYLSSMPVSLELYVSLGLLTP